MTIWWVVGWATKWVQIGEILGVQALGKLRWDEIVRELLGRGVMTVSVGFEGSSFWFVNFLLEGSISIGNVQVGAAGAQFL